MDVSYFSDNFQKINDDSGLGKVGNSTVSEANIDVGNPPYFKNSSQSVVE